MNWKMAESWANFIHNFNERSGYYTKVFSILNFQFYQNFILFHLFYDWNLLLHANITVTYSYLQLQSILPTRVKPLQVLLTAGLHQKP
jgi:hypothetical protein